MSKKKMPVATTKHLPFGDFGSRVMQDLPIPYKYTTQYFLERTPYPATRRDFRKALYIALAGILIVCLIGYYVVNFLIRK
jgi:uncharacterized protein (DUF3820 family)